MNDFLKDIIKETGNEYASLASEGVTGGDVTNYIDTGSYAFNALLSGSIHGGLPGNRITAIAGEAATGKTFFALGICKHFLDTDKNAGVVFFESENALSRDMIEQRGIDSKRVVVVPVATVQEFRTQSIKILDKYLEQEKDKRQPLMFVLDSLGMLSTTKENNDEWVTVKANVKKHFKKLHNLDVEELNGLAIMTDTDNSKLKAISYYQNIYFSSE